MSYLLGFVIVVLLLLLYATMKDKPKSTFRHDPAAPGFEFFEAAPEPPRNPSSYGWADKIQEIALDPDVKKSHKAFVTAQDIVPRVSAHSIRELDTYPVKFVGLRRPNLSVPVSRNARVVTSEDVDQMPKSRPFTIF